MWNCFGVICAFLILASISIDAKSINQEKITDRIDTYKDSVIDFTKVKNKSLRNDVQDLIIKYRLLRTKKSDADMRIIATVGLVSGALKVQDEMKTNLQRLSNELIINFNDSTPQQNFDKLVAIEETIQRDKASIDVMNSILKFARNEKTFENFQNDMKQILKENKIATDELHNKRITMSADLTNNGQRKSIQTGKLNQRSQKSIKFEMMEKLDDVKQMIDRHTRSIQSSVTLNAKETIDFVQLLQKQQQQRRNTQVDAPQTSPDDAHKTANAKLNSALTSLLELWNNLRRTKGPDPEFELAEPVKSLQTKKSTKDSDSTKIKNSKEESKENTQEDEEPKFIIGVEPKLDFNRRQYSIHIREKKQNEIDDDDEDAANEKQDDDDENEIEAKDDDDDGKTDADGSKGDSQSTSSSSEDEPMGLVGLIVNLSGGEEGSDIGALIGAVSQVLTNVLGPGGLDINSVIGSATGLLSSLLAGDENFGRVLGMFFGTGLDGFSGGGGAVNNGQFVGQFLGTFIASLSADPDDEDLPARPDLFIDNVLSGIEKAANKKADGGVVEVQHDDHHHHEHYHPHSDSGSFLTHILTTIAAGVISGLGNASLGSSGGSSAGSAGLFTGSAHGSSDNSYHDHHYDHHHHDDHHHDHHHH